jgi:hypothetical protein
MAAKFLLADTCVAGAHSSGWDSDSCDTFLPYNPFALIAAIPPSTLHHIHIPFTPHRVTMNTSVTDDIFVAAILAAICSAFSALAP